MSASSPSSPFPACTSAKIEKDNNEECKRVCCPQPLSKEAIPLFSCSISLFLTFVGSWSCSFFEGADIGFTGGNYGIWTLQDNSGKCQLWDAIFFSYDLGPELKFARFWSFGSMIVGLSTFTLVSQAQQLHIINWGAGVSMAILLLTSIMTTWIFNMWIAFWLLTYIVFNLIVRALFIRPVYMRISRRGSTCIGFLFLLCCFMTLLTLFVLESDFCTCETLTEDRLQGRITRDPCEEECIIGPAGFVTIGASVGWLLTAILTFKIGIQPKAIYHLSCEKAALSNFGFGACFLDCIDRVRRPVRTARAICRNRKESCRGDDLKPAGSLQTDGDTESGDSEDDRSLDDDSGTTADNGSPLEPNDVKHRARWQIVYCDFRFSTESGQKERRTFWLSRTALAILFFVYAFLIVFLIGAKHENKKAEQAPDTSRFFITDVVCAFDKENPSAPFITFPTKDDADAAGMTVAHCGECALCSNMPDVETYVRTRKTIADSAKQCSRVALFGSYEDLVDCLETNIDFSHQCTTCWADNMKNTGKECLFTCMETLFTGFMEDNNVQGAGEQGWLNRCLHCDEKLSGPAFVQCSGVARRRLGIKSEIERSPDQQCSLVDVDWLDVVGVS